MWSFKSCSANSPNCSTNSLNSCSHHHTTTIMKPPNETSAVQAEDAGRGWIQKMDTEDAALKLFFSSINSNSSNSIINSISNSLHLNCIWLWLALGVLLMPNLVNWPAHHFLILSFWEGERWREPKWAWDSYERTEKEREICTDSAQNLHIACPDWSHAIISLLNNLPSILMQPNFSLKSSKTRIQY